MKKLRYEKLEVMHPRIKNKFQLPVGTEKPPRISPHEVLQSWLINTAYHLLVNRRIIRGGEGALRGGEGGGGLLTFFPWKVEGGGS